MANKASKTIDSTQENDESSGKNVKMPKPASPQVIKPGLKRSKVFIPKKHMPSPRSSNKSSRSFQLSNAKISVVDINNYEIINNLQKSTKFESTILVREKITKKKYIAEVFNVTFNQNQKKKFIQKMSELIFFNHPTIVQYHGISFKDFEGNDNLTIYTEYIENVPLSKIINSNKITNFDNTKKQKILIGISRGMMILHAHNIIHGNLNPDHILIDNNYEPHITGFGLLKIFYEDESLDSLASSLETLEFMSPEDIKKNNCSQMGDVFSFGILMYEIITGEIVKKTEKVTNFRKLKFTDNVKEGFKRMIEKCCAFEPNDRPTFSELYNKLSMSDEDFLQASKNKIINDNDEKNTYCFDNVNLDNLHDYIDEISNVEQQTNQDYENENMRLKSENPKLKLSKSSSQKRELLFEKMTCISCNQRIEEEEEFIYYSGFEYHKNCLKCAICQKKIENITDFENFVCVTPGLFFCQDDYDKYQITMKLPLKILNEYFEKMIYNGIIEAFDKPIEKDFINSEIVLNSYQLNKNYMYFVPTVTFHFEFQPEKIDFKKLMKILPEEAIIINIEKGSTLITIALILADELSGIKQKYCEIIDSIKSKLNSSMGKSIVGNILNEPSIKIPTDEDIKEFYSKKSINILQNTSILDNIDFEDIKKEVQKKLSSKKNKNLEFLYENISLFESAEKHVRQNIIDNGIEMIIISQTLIANKYLNLNEQIKEEIISKFGQDCLSEDFLYHGTNLSNQFRIVDHHFLMPDENLDRKRDDGYFGIGIYATENIFYASMYKDYFHFLKKNEKSTVICCKVVFNEQYIQEMQDASYEGQNMSDECVENYGVHHALIGSKNRYHTIEQCDVDKNLVTAEEFVFGNKYQIIPICSFIIKKTDFFVLWIDERGEYRKYLNDLKQKVEENIYYFDNVQNAIELYEKKKRNKMKLILSLSDVKWGKDTLEMIRKIIGSNTICLVFSEHSIQECQKVFFKYENVLFTDSVHYLRRFSTIDMTKKEIINYLRRLEAKSIVKFNINPKTIFNFNSINKFK